MATEFGLSSALKNACDRIISTEPAKWGSQQHLSALCLMLANASNEWAEIEKDASGKEVRKAGAITLEQWKEALAQGAVVTIPLAVLKAELAQDAKLAECANFFKHLRATEMMEETTAKKSEYL